MDIKYYLKKFQQEDSSMQDHKLMYGLSKYLLDRVTIKDGGFGDNQQSSPLNTAEVLCGLISARSGLYLSGCLPTRYDSIIKNAVEYLHNTQLDSGGWAIREIYSSNDRRERAKGNTVSTCLVLWALILHYNLIEKDDRLINIIRKVMTFLDKCYVSNMNCRYSPDLETERFSPGATAYMLLSYSLILSCDSLFNSLSEDERTKVSNKILRILGSINNKNNLDVIRGNPFSAIFIYYSILLLSEKKYINPDAVLLEVFKNIIAGLAQTQCTEPFNEKQVIGEIGKSIRPFTHYVPVWIHILNSQLKNDNQIFKEEVLKIIRQNILDSYAVSIREGTEYKQRIWTTGLTLFALAH
jgi:hypothetical protein